MSYTIKFLTALAAHEKVILWSGDVKGAYLEALRQRLHMKRIYIKLTAKMRKLLALGGMDLPPRNGKKQAVLLERCLYGCSDSGKGWWLTFKDMLHGIGFLQCPHDPCLFTLNHPDHGLILLATHTDDTLIYAKLGKSTLDWLHNELTAPDKCNSRLSSWGKAETFVGMKFEQDIEHPTRKGIFISCPGALKEWGKTYDRPEEVQSTISSESFDEIIREEWGGDSRALTPDEQRIQAMLQSVV